MRVAGCSAVARRAAVEDIGGACLGQEEREKDEAGTREPHEFPHGPLPAFVFGGETANERPKSGATDGGNAPNGDTVDLFLLGAYMSAMEAPPVARTGLPMKPVRKRNARSMPKFLA